MKNERGYTLVIVLLMITLIFTFSLVLVADSVNSAKQNNQTESQYRVTHIAEMGIIYVQEGLLNLSIDELKEEDSRLIDKIDNFVSGKGKVDPELLEREFKIEDITIDKEDNDDQITKTISFNSIGSDENGKEAELTAEIIIKIPKGSQNEGAGLIDIGDIEREEPIKIYEPHEVPSGWSKVEKNATHIFPDGSELGTLQLYEGSAVIVNGEANFNGSVELAENSILIAHGDAKFGSNIRANDNTSILIAGLVGATTISLGKNSVFKAAGFRTKTNINLGEGSRFSVCNNNEFGTATLDGSITNICNDTKFNSNINFINTSITNIKNNAIFDGTFRVDNKSSLNVGNDLTVGGQATINSATIRAFGDANFKTQSGITNSQLHFYRDFTIGRANISNSTINILGNAEIRDGISSFNNSHLYVYGNLILGANLDQFNTVKNGVCAKRIITKNWSDSHREGLKIIRDENRTNCDGLGSGIYELPNLQKPSTPDKNVYFTKCTDSCRITDLTPTIDLDDVKY